MLPYAAIAAGEVLKSVQAVGILQPLVVTSDRRVIDGRYRLAAARALGFADVQALVYDPPAPAEYVFHAKDSREHLSELDRAVLAVQYQQVLRGEYVAARTEKMNVARGAAAPAAVTPGTADAPQDRASGNDAPAAVASSAAEPVRHDSRKEACERFGVAERKFRAVKRLATYRPDLFQQVVDGTMTPKEALHKKGKNVDDRRAAQAAEALVRDEDVTVPDIENVIHVGDAAAVLARVPDAVASLVMFSPPYPGIKNEEYDPPLPAVTYAQYLRDLRPVLEQALRASRAGGRLALVVDNVRNPAGGGPDYMLPVAQDLTRLAQEAGWRYFNEIAWCKDQLAGKGTNFGSFARCSSPFQNRSHEWVLLFFKETHVLAGDERLCDLTREEHLAWYTTEWRVRPEARKDIRQHHCAPFPEELAHRLIKLLTYRRDLVIDPMNGSGTTTAVAARLQRRYVGIDRSAAYCAFARARTKAEPSNTNGAMARDGKNLSSRLQESRRGQLELGTYATADDAGRTGPAEHIGVTSGEEAA